ncbi:plasmid pRiA4b ORF-3 family protein [Anaerosporobacter sp.]|uniref:plasmid pRiA4b ORF-3 family protein n=1 Tax=Anaerosporobacter sp. TaxID=1872529 RepID=UPI00286EE930|nr:plasmid pRiA4b ORF-3 family protein [Anaerosporobacter sp.]
MKAYEFKITLIGAKPPIWRKVVVPVDITFKRFHDTIQMAMGWQDYHLYEFEFKDLDLRFSNDEERYDEDARKVSAKIDKYITQVKSFVYTYDFADYWQHKVELTKSLEDYAVGYPQVLSFKGNCPPEDCGGICDYEDFLLAWNDPENEEHESIREWGTEQEYGDYDLEQVNGWMKEFLKLKKLKA